MSLNPKPLASQQTLSRFAGCLHPEPFFVLPHVKPSPALQDAFREALPRYDASQHPFAALAANAAAGAAAGALSLALVYPFEFATVRMAADLGTGAADRQYGTGESGSTAVTGLAVQQ